MFGFGRRSNDEKEVRLPDVLGYITRGVRAEVGAVECAMAVDPKQTPAGQRFNTFLVVQSKFDCEVDVRVQLLLPHQDASGHKGAFATKTDKLLIGLEPAEVGVVVLPLLSSLSTAPSPDYILGVDLNVRHRGKGKKNLVRCVDELVLFDPADANMDEELAARFETLRQLDYSAELMKRSRVVAGFEVTAPVGPSSSLDLAPAWERLWTMRDHIDADVVLKEAGPQVEAALSTVRRDRVFKPIMQQVQTAFKNAGYPLQTGEALFITKLLTLVVEAKDTLGMDMPPPRWYVHLCRLVYNGEERVLNYPEQVITRLLWRDLVIDGTILGFNMVTTVLSLKPSAFLSNILGREIKEGEAEAMIKTYGQGLADALSLEEPAGQQMLGVVDAYVPLVLGGLVANARMTMPRESALDSVHLLKKARDQRGSEQSPQNQQMFATIDRLIERGFDMLT